METGSVTTPFGRRSMTLGMLTRQFASRSIEPGKSIDKWKLYRALCEARPKLGITDRALAVLNALLSFYPKNELAEEHGLIVFPSNAQLSLRAHGMAEQTLRRHLAVLIEAGLLIRRDSPNGKRYAHKGSGGQIEMAFGFSLAPLLARSEEIEHMAEEVIAERLRLQRLRERLTLCRRDLTKLIETASQETETDGEWTAISESMQKLLAVLPRVPTHEQLSCIIEQMELLRDKAAKHLELLLNMENLSVNPYQNERHIQNSESESYLESEPRMETPIEVKQPRNPQADSSSKDTVVSIPPASAKQNNHLKSFPLALVLQACPQISDYGPSGSMRNWRDLMSAAMVVHSMLGISPSAYRQACAIMGAENAAAVIACILEKSEQISSAGGYLRDLTRRAEREEFGLGPMLMALLRNRMPSMRQVS